MAKVLIWAPESDYDRDALLVLLKKIVLTYGLDISFGQAPNRAAFDAACRKPGGLKGAVKILLESSDYIIFFLDRDSTEAVARHRKEAGSLLTRIQQVSDSNPGRVRLHLVHQELEAWLLVDCLGICCYHKHPISVRDDVEWKKFAGRLQPGRTDLIQEAVPGGFGAKEKMIEVSTRILRRMKPRLSQDRSPPGTYSESDAPQVAEHIDVSPATLGRNDSLADLVEKLRDMSTSGRSREPKEV